MKSRIGYALIAIAALTLVVVGVSAYGMMGGGFGKGFGMMESGKGSFQNGMMGRGMMAGMSEMHEQVEKAIESRDYEAFLRVHEEYGMPMKISEENFLKMAEWHEAVENNDYDRMAELREEGFGGFGMMGGGRGVMGGKGGCPMMG